MIPISSRRVKHKTYYLLFAHGGEYSGCYATIQASSLDRAKQEAIEKYGVHNYGGVEINEERAKQLVKLFGLKEITA